MTPEKLESLKKVITKYGFGDTVKIDNDGICIDGEHKTKAAISLNIEKIPFTKFTNVKTPLDRKILRQIFNKLRGEHDVFKDAKDFKFIDDKGELEEFASMMAEEQETFEKEIEAYEAMNLKPEDIIEESFTPDEKLNISFTFSELKDFEKTLQVLKTLDPDKEKALLILVNKHED